MKLEQLRKAGSQALDEMTEFILTERSLTIWEQTGNGLYSLARSYKVTGSKFETAFIDMQIRDAEKLLGVEA